MEKTMRRLALLLVVALLGGTDRLVAQETVETRGVTSVIKLDEVIFGHLTELNGKFKLRATELTFAPDGYVGVHHHIGPGIRYVISGELTFAEGGQETVYKAGEYYFETGNLAHTAQNKTNEPLRVLSRCSFQMRLAGLIFGIGADDGEIVVGVERRCERGQRDEGQPLACRLHHRGHLPMLSRG
jgi:quercetin dioxygenase-like cupin family protein